MRTSGRGCWSGGIARSVDWHLAHPNQEPPSDPGQAHLAYQNLQWKTETRHSAFLILGTAAWLRGTPSIFSYDWLNGVALAAGVLGLAGLFATRRMGLVLLLRGKEIAALTTTEAVLHAGIGARQTYRRKPHDPLHPAERCLIWELDDG